MYDSRNEMNHNEWSVVVKQSNLAFLISYNNF